MPRQPEDLTAKRFGRLIVLTKGPTLRGPPTNSNAKGGRLLTWVCRCDCGVETTVRGDSLRRGATKSCGRHRLEAITKHGESPRRVMTKEYYTWQGLKGRCLNPNNKDYPNYGGRGISVCERWLDSFPNFLADMGRAPAPDFQIERRDNDGNYEPSNCRWATGKDQARNRRERKDGMFAKGRKFKRTIKLSVQSDGCYHLSRYGQKQ